MSTTDNFNELETRARQNAAKEIANLFQKPDDLEKLEQVKTRYQRMKSAKETQLKNAVHIQLDGVRNGLKKMDSALRESQHISTRMDGMFNSAKKLDGLPEKLSELNTLCNRYNQLAAAMENMANIVRVPETVAQTRHYLNNVNILEGHKLIQELEGTRDELMSEIHRQNPTSPDLLILQNYFRDVPGLNVDMLNLIKNLAVRILSAAITNNVHIVSILRVIEREERADEIWRKRNMKTGFTPPGRPKEWKRIFFDKMNENICNRVMECSVDEEDSRSCMVRHNEIIRINTRNDLNIVKATFPTYFPPHYDIYKKVVAMYHDAIAEHVENLMEGELTDSEVVQLLGWLNEYHSENFMGDPLLRINFQDLKLKKDINLLSKWKLDQLQTRYLQTTRTRLCNWMSNTLTTDVSDWHSRKPPELDGSSNYFTSLPAILMTPIGELVGDNNLLQYVGFEVKKRFFYQYSEDLANFTASYLRELKQFRDEYFENRERYPAFFEYILANANNCYSIVSSYETYLNQEFRHKPHVLSDMEKLKEDTKKCFTELVNNHLLVYALDVVLLDLSKIITGINTKEWMQAHDNTAEYMIGTMEDYKTSIIHLRPDYQPLLLSKISQRVCVEYIKALLTRRVTFANVDERRRIGQKIDDEGRKLKNYIEQLPVDKNCAEAFRAICLIAQILINDDISMILLDIMNLQRSFPDVRKEQISSMLMLRGDLKQREAQDIASDYKQSQEPAKIPIFTLVASAMS